MSRSTMTSRYGRASVRRLFGVARGLVAYAGGERRVRLGAGGRVERDRPVSPPAPPPAPAVARLVDGDAVEPGAQVRVAAEARDVSEGLQESLLRQVARLLGVLRQAVEQSVDVRVPLLDEPVE